MSTWDWLCRDTEWSYQRLRLEAALTAYKPLLESFTVTLGHIRRASSSANAPELDCSSLIMVLSFILIQNRQWVKLNVPSIDNQPENEPTDLSNSLSWSITIDRHFCRGKTRLAKWYAPYSVRMPLPGTQTSDISTLTVTDYFWWDRMKKSWSSKAR